MVEPASDCSSLSFVLDEQSFCGGGVPAVSKSDSISTFTSDRSSEADASDGDWHGGDGDGVGAGDSCIVSGRIALIEKFDRSGVRAIESVVWCCGCKWNWYSCELKTFSSRFTIFKLYFPNDICFTISTAGIIELFR